MKSKIHILIAFSVFSILTLLTLQVYLLNTTYQNKTKQYKSVATKAIFQIYNTPYSDSIYWNYRTSLKDIIIDYYNNDKPKRSILKQFNKNNIGLNILYLKNFNEQLNRTSLSGIKIKVSISSLIIHKSETESDTVFLAKPNKQFLILGSNFPDQTGIVINTSNWKDVLIEGLNYPSLNLKTSILIHFPKVIKDVLKDMIIIFFISFFILLFVVILFYFSIVSLIKQKKITDIKTDFINNITHEFKTPLATLQLCTEMLQTNQIQDNKESIKETIDIISRQNIRLQNLLNQVLTQSLSNKIEINIAKEKTELISFTDTLINDYQLSIQSKNISISLHSTTNAVRINTDRFYISIVIQNLLTNAVKYGGTIIELTIKEVNNNISIAVSDNGIGIEKSEQKYIFDKFYRVSENHKHNYKGLGLGLFYSKEILRQLGGEISVVSIKEKGSAFTIELPIN